MSVCISYKNVALQRVGVLKTIDIEKTDAWKKKCLFCHYYILKLMILKFNHTFAITVTIYWWLLIN